MEPIKKLVVYGQKGINEEGAIVYNLQASNRDVSNQHEIELEKNDKLLELILVDGTSWMCDASTMHENLGISRCSNAIILNNQPC